jgi:hypothetical protein
MVTTGPIIVIVHELGHARALRRVAGRRSVILVGSGPTLLIRHFVNYDLRISLFAFAGGACVYDPRGLTVAQIRAVVSGGPWATVILGLVCALGATLIADMHSLPCWFLAAGFIDSLISAILNLMPVTGKGGVSDGLHLWHLRGLDPAHVPVPAVP